MGNDGFDRMESFGSRDVVDSEAFKVVLLGTGTSHGIPMIACDCPVCTSSDPRDRRTRASLYVDYGDRAVLIDTAPEFRLQSVAAGVRRLDAVLFTHHHADHVCGLDDLRRFNAVMRGAVPCYSSPETAVRLKRMFRYCFDPDPNYPSTAPKLTLHEIDEAPFELFGRRIVPIPLMHGALPVLGFRFGAFAYCTDCSLIPESSLERLRGLDTLVLDALRRTPHPTHFNLEQAVAMAGEIGARRTLFTHIAHELKHEETNADLPAGMALAYDGQVIDARA